MGLPLWITGCVTLTAWVILRNVIEEMESQSRDYPEDVDPPELVWYVIRDVLPAVAVGLLGVGLFYY
jgi:hypothetical protein